MLDIITDEIKSFFIQRTIMHIKRVQKYLKKIQALGLEEVDNSLLSVEQFHDGSKFLSPEVEPYIHLTWKYKTANDVNPYIPDEKVQKRIDEATWHHITNNLHHPEYWDSDADPAMLNSKDRDKPSGVMVDATSMPLTYIASMMADWLAMSEEKKTDVNDWIKKNVNIRWRFTPEQVALIEKIAQLVQVEK
jgi:hypothetical protein